MTCGTCEGKGYIHQESNFEEYIEHTPQAKAPGGEYHPCPDCEGDCDMCSNKGLLENGHFCPACWAWKKCHMCDGVGEYEEGVYEPQAGGLVSGLYDCDNCQGKGWVIDYALRDDLDAI